jgi:hypothetical protein
VKEHPESVSTEPVSASPSTDGAPIDSERTDSTQFVMAAVLIERMTARLIAECEICRRHEPCGPTLPTGWAVLDGRFRCPTHLACLLAGAVATTRRVSREEVR